ncbi:GNAT superfamily N-acetyltransferase [Psychromicrobium silvestre]|uniref:GNAT superfamily N-acetyltransferase n=1 Tax=Psychromicrobium silvestre TaxID=1645614 RepID=A0A7Y9S710_9MICC|nr:GNAT family N-acetyltransferase [Psychromicrobium silvestre]NYE95300.1 GNAT superfamily N-acetyltransferase [Psychromicrobium silvestre]
MTGKITVEELSLPEELSGDGAADFLAAVELIRQEHLRLWGNDHLAYTPEEMLNYAQDPYERHLHLVARRDGALLGHCEIIIPVEDNQHLVWVALTVHPDAQGTGIGRALATATEDFARAQGRLTVTFETSHPADSLAGELLEPKSGIGQLPLVSRPVRFARAAGYELEQVERFSSCQLPVDPALLAEQGRLAQAAAGAEYRLVSWTSPCPEEWLDDLAWLQSRMSTDAPMAGLDFEEEPWDAARVRKGEALAQQMGRTILTTAVEHIPSGKLAGFTELILLGHRSDVILQGNTLVLHEHRGHRLGMLIKVANLERLAEQRPDARCIYTWNAAENDYMLAVNIALGFTPAGFTGEWQKVLK